MSTIDFFLPGETMLIEQQGWYVKGFLNVKTGFIIFTDQRVVFVEKKIIVGGGLVATAADKALGVSKPKVIIDLPYSEILSWKQPRKVDIRLINKRGEKYTLRGGDYKQMELILIKYCGNS